MPIDLLLRHADLADGTGSPLRRADLAVEGDRITAIEAPGAIDPGRAALVIDAEGGVWFGTDGNFGTNGHADALYYLDLDPAHRDGQEGIVNATYGKGLRVVSGPSDSEATGPALSADMRSLFFSVQHPGEEIFSTWPAKQ